MKRDRAPAWARVGPPSCISGGRHSGGLLQSATHLARFTSSRIMDTLTKAERTERMRRIGSRDTSIELSVRRLLYRLGYRYRLHYPRLPGRPDLAFPGRKKAIFVNGCFWHQHEGCRSGQPPKSRQDFWIPKLRKNVERDQRQQGELSRLGWRSLVIWECELKDLSQVENTMTRFLGPPGTSH